MLRIHIGRRGGAEALRRISSFDTNTDHFLGVPDGIGGRISLAMKILLTGANGYVGLRLLSALLEGGHSVHAVVRDSRRLPLDELAVHGERLQVVEADLDAGGGGQAFPEEVEVAYFLVHAMGDGANFAAREEAIARNFVERIEATRARQVIYLGGITPEHGRLSEHLESRRRVGEILGGSRIPLTTLRASIIVGSGSASFEIIRDLVEKLPVFITPRWTRHKCQPIAVRNVLAYLQGVAGNADAMGRSFDIGGPEVLTYEELLRQYAVERGLRRWIIAVPFLSARLSSYWLYSMTSTTFRLARALVDSLAHDTVCGDEAIRALVPQELLTYRQAVEKAFVRIAQNHVPSTWYDALASGSLPPSRMRAIRTPEHGIVTDRRVAPLKAPREAVVDAIFSLGGRSGWPSMNWAWRVRGMMDRLVGGIGLRRGRRDPTHLRPGDAVDFWRVILADRKAGRLILFAEMRLPGEAWLEFEVTDRELWQTATFRPLGLLGRLYWLGCMPFHAWIFPRMARTLASPR
jgi:uncharacterized protein YbjT (DUF2867 family)